MMGEVARYLKPAVVKSRQLTFRNVPQFEPLRLETGQHLPHPGVHQGARCQTSEGGEASVDNE
jgi:hypothetical protein